MLICLVGSSIDNASTGLYVAWKSDTIVSAKTISDELGKTPTPPQSLGRIEACRRSMAQYGTISRCDRSALVITATKVKPGWKWKENRLRGIFPASRF